MTEHEFELLAAFGPGVTVVNLLTGEETRTPEAIVPHFCWDEDCTAIVDAPRYQERVYCREHSVLKDQGGV